MNQHASDSIRVGLPESRESGPSSKIGKMIIIKGKVYNRASGEISQILSSNMHELDVGKYSMRFESER